MSIKRGLLLLLVAFAEMVHAQSTLQPDSLAISAEWLFMQLSISQPEFVINSSSPTQPIGDRIAATQNWYSGYRATGAYAIEKGLGELFVRWTYFPEILEQDHESGAGLFGGLNFPQLSVNGTAGEARIKDKFAITSYDLLLKQKVIRRPCYSLSLNGGAQYLHLNFEESLFYPILNSSYLVEYRSRVRGVGPEMGVDYIYGFSKCFTFVGSVHSAGLLGLMHKSFEQLEGSTVLVDIENDKYWSFILTADLRLGFKYSRPIDLRRFRWGLSCWNLDVEVGYEIISFFNSFERIYFVDAQNIGSSFNERRTLTLQGPYLQLGASF